MMTQAWLKEHFDYQDGYLILKKYWNDRVNCRRCLGDKMVAGYEKGKTRADRYERIVIDGVYCLIHHLIWMWHYGYMPEFEENLVMDHIDTNKLNNRIGNLRWITQSENSYLNMRKL